MHDLNAVQPVEARPLTSLERRVGELWGEFVELPLSLKPTDNFFSLGGDSLAMTMLLFRIKEELGVDLPPSVLLESPELYSLCEQIDCFSEPIS